LLVRVVVRRVAIGGAVDAAPGLTVSVPDADDRMRELVQQDAVGFGDVATDDDLVAVGLAGEEAVLLDAIDVPHREVGAFDRHLVFEGGVEDEGCQTVCFGIGVPAQDDLVRRRLLIGDLHVVVATREMTAERRREHARPDTCHRQEGGDEQRVGPVELHLLRLNAGPR